MSQNPFEWRSHRQHAFILGLRLLWAATNPWSGLPYGYRKKALSQPPYPEEFPKWLPVEALRGHALNLRELVLIKRSALGKYWKGSAALQHSGDYQVAPDKHHERQTHDHSKGRVLSAATIKSQKS